MKKILVVSCAVFVLVVAGKALADEHSGHKQGHEQKSPAAKAEPAAQAGTTYKCPYHKEMVSNKPAKCPKCGMDMTRMEGYDLKYRCPMHKDMVSDKPGKCEKCNMALERAEERRFNDDDL